MSVPSVGAIVVAAGSSRRMGGIDKLWADLGGRPLLARTLEAILSTPSLRHLVVVAAADTLSRLESLRASEPWSRIDALTLGGETRQDSVFCGLQILPPCDLVLIHDGARPLVSTTVIERAIVAAQRFSAVIVAAPVTDTIKIVDDEQRVVATPDRARLRAAQTPQVFASGLLRAAYAQAGAARATCTDDAALAELAGYAVYTVEGDRQNIKVSTPADLTLVRSLWAEIHPERSP